MRIEEYIKLEREDEIEKDLDNQLELRGWPSKGELKFQHIHLKYREDLFILNH